MFFAILFMREFFSFLRFDCASIFHKFQNLACQTYANFKTPSKTHKTKLIRASFLLVFFAFPYAKKHAKTPTPSAEVILFLLPTLSKSIS
jgi:hypothetical protein